MSSAEDLRTFTSAASCGRRRTFDADGSGPSSVFLTDVHLRPRADPAGPVGGSRLLADMSCRTESSRPKFAAQSGPASGRL